MAVLTIVMAVLVASLSRFAADEAKAWLPWLTVRLLQFAVNRLPVEQRERRREEWLADLESYPGSVAPFIRTLGMVWTGLLFTSLIEERIRPYAIRSFSILRVYGLYILGLIIWGGTLGAIWAKFQNRAHPNPRFSILMGAAAGLVISCALLAEILRKSQRWQGKDAS